jgi:hypothetical protein
MSKATTVYDDAEIESLEEEGVEDGDYGFVIGADGELKHMFTPDDFFLDPPPAVKKILKIFGIANINQIAMDAGNDTVH